MLFGTCTVPHTFTVLMRLYTRVVQQRWKITALHYLDAILLLNPDQS